MLIAPQIMGTIGSMSGMDCVPKQFLHCLTRLVIYNERFLVPGNEIKYTGAGTTFHAGARDQLAADTEGAWLLQLDCDHVFDPDLCARLLGTLETRTPEYPEGFDVVTGLYFGRAAPWQPTIYRWDEETGGFDRMVRYKRGSVFQIAGSGGGALMVRKRVFERIEAELHEDPFSIVVLPNGCRLGEDLSFWYRLRTLTPPVHGFCDARVLVRHLFVDTAGEEHHLRHLETAEAQGIDQHLHEYDAVVVV